MASSRACVLAVETWLTTVKATGRCLVRFFSQACCSDSEARSLCFHLELRCFLSLCIVSCKSFFQELDDLIGIILRSRLTEKYIKWSILSVERRRSHCEICSSQVWLHWPPLLGLRLYIFFYWTRCWHAGQWLGDGVSAHETEFSHHLCRLWKFDVLVCWQSQLEDDWAHEQEF